MLDDNGNRDGSSGFELEYFEKNRYFQGKLMNARDMVTEQEYHASRLETVTRLTDGAGIVSGLTISEFSETDDELQLTVEPGLAIDPGGRPIVVRNPTTRTVPTPNGDAVYIYIEPSTETKDPVPVPGKEPMDDEDSEENRVLEVFEISARETSPEGYKTPASVDLSEISGSVDSVSELADRIADEYHRSERDGVETETDAAVFLGSFKQAPDGSWEPGEERRRRPYVYDNDMLFGLLVEHISDTENPHDTRIGEPSEYVESELDQIEGFRMRLQEMHREMKDLGQKLEMHTEYTTHKSLKTTMRFFDELADRFQHNGDVSRASLAVVDAIEDAIREEVYDDTERYLTFVEQLFGDIRQLSDELEGEATETSYRQFDAVVDELEELTAGETTVIEVARTMDRLGETADMLQERTEVVPEGEQ